MSSDEDDEDYVPGMDEDEDEEQAPDAQTVADIALARRRKRKANEIWEELVAQESEERKKLHALQRQRNRSVPNIFTKKEKAIRKRKTDKMLRKILGKKKAAALTREQMEALAHPPDETVSSIPRSVPIVPKKVKVSETLKFAGETIQVEREVMQTEAEKKPTTQTSLDAALNSLSEPKSLSTVAKSSVDWDQYKERSGVADDLEQAAKDGYISRKEFLDRCDVRQFEKERDHRQETRLKASKS